MSIDLRFSNVNPPSPEPSRSIYADILNLPDPVLLGLTVRVFNYDSVGLYMKVDGYDGAWTIPAVNLGLLGAGSNMYSNLDQMGSRARPAAALTETITIRLRAYTDSGYTVLKWTYTRAISVVFIKSDDGSWTQDFLDNFDDGTVDGWAAVKSSSYGDMTEAVATDQVLSPAYSLKGTYDLYNISGAQNEFWFYHYKTFATPNKATVYALIDVRISSLGDSSTYVRVKNLSVLNSTALLIYLGKPYDIVLSGGDYIPQNRWLRIVVLLPSNSSVQIRVLLDALRYATAGVGEHSRIYIWLDDFKIISK